MQVRSTSLAGVLVIEPEIHHDNRGYFVETFHRDKYREAGIDLEPAVAGQSSSKKNTVRGLHFQTRNVQAKLVYVLRGRIWDVAVDVRPSSPTFRQWAAVELDSERRHQIYVPFGFAHGFCVTSDDGAEVAYQIAGRYDPGGESGVVWNDPELALPWPLTGPPILSAKDQALLPLRDAKKP
jgi:dTDP-4-dehydrorhamnose 3,5-epimerase